MKSPNPDSRVTSSKLDFRDQSVNPDLRVESSKPETRSPVSNLRSPNQDSYKVHPPCYRFGLWKIFCCARKFERKISIQFGRKANWKKHSTIIVNDDGTDNENLKMQITQFHQRTSKSLLVIFIEKEFLSNDQRFTSPLLETIFWVHNSFFYLLDKNVMLSNNEIWPKQEFCQFLQE